MATSDPIGPPAPDNPLSDDVGALLDEDPVRALAAQFAALNPAEQRRFRRLVRRQQRHPRAPDTKIRQRMADALRETGGHQMAAARLLGVSRQYVGQLLDREPALRQLCEELRSQHAVAEREVAAAKRELELQRVADALRETKGSRVAAARLLGRSPYYVEQMARGDPALQQLYEELNTSTRQQIADARHDLREQLLTAMERHGWTQSALARAAGVALTSVHSFVHGKPKLSIKLATRLLAIAEAGPHGGRP
jgi:DNA-binding transcriptional regulator YdaS (Cro superfamily)